MADGRLRREARRYGHLEDDIFIAGDSFYGDQSSARADIDGGTEFEDGAPGGVGAMNKNRECDWEPLPAAGFVFGLTHK